jgi:hypothetical protein
MKQIIDYTTSETPRNVQLFISIWKKNKNYPRTQFITIGEALELLIGTTRNLHREDSVGRFFNNVLDNGDSAVLWEGKELLDILYWQVVQAIKKRLSMVKLT